MRVDGDLHAVDRHPGQPRRLLVAADGVDVAPEDRRAQQHGEERHDGQEEQARHGSTIRQSRARRTSKSSVALVPV